MTERYRVSGMIEEKETGRPLPDLIVRAFDKDLVFDDLLGFDSTDAEGRFKIEFTEKAFRDLAEQRPDIFLRIYDRSGRHLLHETLNAIRKDASTDERFQIAIAAAKLVPR